jgi:dipeptidyl-peptidase-4
MEGFKMRRWATGFLAAVFCLLTSPLWGRPTAFPPDPATSYEEFRRHGFKVMVSKRLPDGAECLRRLDDRLEVIADVLPAVHLSILRGVTVWIEPRNGPIAPSIYDKAGAFYVPLGSKSDPTFYGLRAETRGGVVVFADGYLRGDLGKRATDVAPGFLLHEMAHAIHDRVLGYDEPSVKTAYQRAMDGKLYDTVQTVAWDEHGHARVERGPAYARTNDLEYFAELSVAYFNQGNWHYPKTRDDLADHDPGGYVLMDSFWRPESFRIVNDFPWPMSVDRVAKTGRRYRALDLMPGKEKAFDGWEGMSVIATDLLDGKEYRVEMPSKNARLWRVSPATTGLMPPSTLESASAIHP